MPTKDKMWDHHAPYHPYIAAIAIMILVVVLVFFVLSIFLLLQRDYWQFPVQKLAANSMIAHIIFSILGHSLSIHLKLLYRPLGKVSCWLHHHVFIGYLLITPYTLFMFTVERMVYIRNPSTHAQKFGKISIGVMLALPWILTVLVGFIINIFLDNEIVTKYVSRREWDFNETSHTCMVIATGDVVGRVIMWGGVGALLPLLACIIISIVALCMWCFYKKKLSRGTNYALMGEPVEKAVRDSVIAVALLNFLYVAVMFYEFLAHAYIPVKATGFTFYGVIEGIVFLGTLADVRDKISHYCKRCCPRRQDSKAVRYNTNDEENVDL